MCFICQWTMTCRLPKSCFCWATPRRSSSAGWVTSSNASRGSTRRWVLPQQHKRHLLKHRRALRRECLRGRHPGVHLICHLTVGPSKSSPADSSRHQGSQGEPKLNLMRSFWNENVLLVARVKPISWLFSIFLQTIMLCLLIPLWLFQKTLKHIQKVSITSTPRYSVLSKH